MAGHTVKITGAGCVSKPFLYALYLGEWQEGARDDPQRVTMPF